MWHMAAAMTAVLLAASTGSCPPGATELARFNESSGSGGPETWLACEDLSQPDGSLSLVASGGKVVWLPKTHEPYVQGADEEYYLGLGKQTVLSGSKSRDVLGSALLSCKHAASPAISCFTWRDVARALPPIRRSGPGGHWPSWEGCDGVRSFVGARSTSTDATFSDFGEDCSKNGFPSPLGQSLPGYSVINWTAVNKGEGPIMNWTRYINLSAVADGLVGELPVLSLYFPVIPDNPYHKLPAGATRYWTMLAAPLADPSFEGRREQDVWFRFQQIDCAGATAERSGYGRGGNCTAAEQFWQNYWWSRTPGRDEDGTAFGSKVAAGAAGFYRNLLRVRRYWDKTLRAEGMMQLSLPEGPDGGTNGTWLNLQAVHSIVRCMVTRRETFHPSYGVSPGYGWQGQDGFQDTFATTATMALEWGAMEFARGVIDNQFQYYIRVEDGMVNYRATEVPCGSRFLTILALYYSYSGEATLLLKHFEKAKALAGWLRYRREVSLSFPVSDPRHGIPFGDDEADSYAHVGGFSGSGHAGPGSDQSEPLWSGMHARNHDLSSAAEMSRAFLEMGRVWVALGQRSSRPELTAHGKELLAIAPLLLHDLHASLNSTVRPAATPPPPDPRTNQGSAAGARAATPPTGGGNCWAHSGEEGCGGWHVRGYPEMLYSGLLRPSQVREIYSMGSGELDCAAVRNCSSGEQFLQVGCPAGGSLIFTHIPFGLAYGLLAADLPERFLLHYYGSSAHSYTRGSLTTPESSFLDRDAPSIAYASAGQTIAPMYLRWMLAYEEPNTRTVWLAKATPREWLLAPPPSQGPAAAAAGDAAAAPAAVRQTVISVARVPTRYGRVSYTLTPRLSAEGVYTVAANISLPPSYASSPPPGGLTLRLRTPLHYLGKLTGVTVGGRALPPAGGVAGAMLDAKDETVAFSASVLKAAPLYLAGGQILVATYG